ncbi:MAG: serine/threonine-protein kinase [Vicinamibacterales bacterium]
MFRWPFRSESPAPSAHPETPRNPDGIEDQEKAGSGRWNFAPGTPIAEGRWVVKSLGGGSRYEACLVWDDRLFSLAVAKILRPDHAEDPGALRDLRREAEILASLAHPVLVRGFGAVYEGKYPHVLIEYLEGPTLGRLIKRQRTLPLEQVLPLALHIAAALQYLATERVVHLDVKPANIVMGVPPRLIDLSIARSFERATRLTDAIGTDAYMAPEQCDPLSWPGRIGHAADVWGLGATLYHAIAGAVPFPRPRGASKSDQPAVRFPQLVREAVPLPKGIPSSLENLVLRMLAKEPEQRPAAREVALAREPLVAAQPWRLTFSSRGRPRAARPRDSRLSLLESRIDGEFASVTR